VQRPLAKNLVYLLIVFFLVGFRFTISAQLLWETEREKEHGILRIKIEGISMDDYYFFVFQNSETKVRDTLRNQEQHLDLGNAKDPYSYSLGNLLKAMPNGLYGKNRQMIYSDWSYVSFPIVGLSEADVFVENGKTKEKMRIHFILNPLDTVDYVF
jgi:hypothetical protein